MGGGLNIWTSGGNAQNVGHLGTNNGFSLRLLTTAPTAVQEWTVSDMAEPLRVSDGISGFLDFLRKSDELLRMAEADMDQTNNETQDILHRIELHDDNYHETASMAKKMRDVRRRRRVAKNIVECTSPVAAWSENHKKEIGELQRLLGEVRKIEQKQSLRTYIQKTKILEKDGKGNG